MKFIIVFFSILLSACSISTEPPKLNHSTYGMVNGEHPAFKKDAIDCAKLAESKVSQPMDVDSENILLEKSVTNKILVAQVANEYMKFFSSTGSCIESKGWQLLK